MTGSILLWRRNNQPDAQCCKRIDAYESPSRRYLQIGSVSESPRDNPPCQLREGQAGPNRSCWLQARCTGLVKVRRSNRGFTPS